MTTYRRAPEAGRGLRLHLNENTGGCSPAVLDAIRSLSAEDIAFYPSYDDVERETAAHLGVERSWMALVNGLDEGLHLVSSLALRPGAKGPACSVIPLPAFEMYAACTSAGGGVAKTVPPRQDFAFPFEEILDAIDERTRLLYLTNPDNPTGRAISPGVVADIAARAPHVTVLVDEAYVDFGGETAVPLTGTHSNVIVGRTFAKAYGLAALRVGCLIAQPGTLAPLIEMRPPYTLNVAAAAGLRAALRDRAWRDTYVAESHRSRQMIYDFCEARDIPYYRSAANFVLVRIGSRAPQIAARLAERQIFIRDRSTQPGCAGCVRITAGLTGDTERCLSALGGLL